jgi:hypothetical protein
MKTIAALLLTTLVTMSAGCAKTDWIDRTLVTVDVTGTWEGSVSGVPGYSGSRDLLFALEQQGATVKGFMATPCGWFFWVVSFWVQS